MAVLSNNLSIEIISAIFLKIHFFRHIYYKMEVENGLLKVTRVKYGHFFGQILIIR